MNAFIQSGWAVLIGVTLFVVGFGLGLVSGDSAIREDCQQHGLFMSNKTIYECKARIK